MIKSVPSVLEIFLSANCPACGASKKANTAFCGQCYHSLPKGFRQALWQRFGEGFEEAFAVSLRWLTKTEGEK